MNNEQVIVQDDVFTVVIQDNINSVDIYEGTVPNTGVVGGDKTFEANLSGETNIVITHNLGKYPSISVFDSSGDEVQGDYNHLTKNSVRLSFSSGFSGKAVFN